MLTTQRLKNPPNNTIPNPMATASPTAGRCDAGARWITRMTFT